MHLGLNVRYQKEAKWSNRIFTAVLYLQYTKNPTDGHGDCTKVAQKVMPHIFFLGNYLFRVCEIHAQYNWMFSLHMLFFHIISAYVYGLTPA